MLRLNLNHRPCYKNIHKDLLSVAKTKEELNYTQAKHTLKNLVDYFSVSKQDVQKPETELRFLKQALLKLEKNIVQIAIFGMVGKGKSSILNSLLGKEAFKTGALHGITKTIATANWKLLKNKDSIYLSGSKYHRIQLIDTPGLDEINGKNRETISYKVAEKADLILFAITEDMVKKEFDALYTLQELGKPVIIVFNKIDQYSELDRLEIYQKICHERIGEMFVYNEITTVAASPLVSKLVKNKQGCWKIKYLKGKPQIEQLKLKILDLLNREGQSLIAFNSMLLADKINEQAMLHKFKTYNEQANHIIQKAAILKFIVIGSSPIIILDLVLGSLVDMLMILTLSDLYNVSITQKGRISLIKKLIISMISISISEFFISFGLNFLKDTSNETVFYLFDNSIFFHLLTRIFQGVIASITCYMIGKVTKRYLISGAIWGPEGPKKVIKDILESLTPKSVFQNIQWTLRSKLKYIE